MVTASIRTWLIATVAGLALISTTLARGADPTSQPQQQRSGAAASESWQPVDCQADRYLTLSPAESVQTGLLWGQKSKAPVGNGRFYGRGRRQMMVDDFGNPIDVSLPETWTFILVQDGQPIQLTAEDPEPLARRVGKIVAVRSKAQAGVAVGGVPAAGPGRYTIQAGDTLSKIARETLGKESDWQKIMEANPGLDPQALVVGKVINLPLTSVGQAVAMPSHLVGWIRAEPTPAVEPIDPKAGWVAVEGDKENYKRWVGGEVTLCGKLVTIKVAGIERCAIVTRGRQVLLARSGPACAERMEKNEQVELRGKPLDGRDADTTESVSAGWIRTAVMNVADFGWQVLAGDDASYNALPGPELVLAGTLTKTAAAAPAAPPAAVTNRIRPMPVVVDDSGATDPGQPQIVLACKQGQVLLEFDQRGLPVVDGWLNKPVQIKCRSVSMESATTWKWRVGSIRAAGVAAPSSQPNGK